ncbi:MAG: hypothetical protein JWM73_2435 [Solirubrobacterales bacterium]|jgi:hypothetical protein|nr:hypothetical protein [Solirubrobacterales bacterium]
MPSQAHGNPSDRGASQEAEGCAPGLCGADVPPLVGSVLTGTGLTLEAAAARLARGEPLPAMTDVQRRMVEERAAASL